MPVTYHRMLDADADGADWREVSRIVLHIDADHETDRVRLAFEGHLARAKWASSVGYRELLRRGWPSGDTRDPLARLRDQGQCDSSA
jgi:hypothetical protein